MYTLFFRRPLVAGGDHPTAARNPVPVPKFFQERGETFEWNNDITRDGKPFLGVVAAGSAAASGAAAAPQIQVVLNWQSALGAREGDEHRSGCSTLVRGAESARADEVAERPVWARARRTTPVKSRSGNSEESIWRPFDNRG